jgi:hypothetical protein
LIINPVAQVDREGTPSPSKIVPWLESRYTVPSAYHIYGAAVYLEVRACFRGRGAGRTSAVGNPRLTVVLYKVLYLQPHRLCAFLNLNSAHYVACQILTWYGAANPTSPRK